MSSSYVARNRRAFTLIEVVTTLTLGSLMAMLAISLVHRTFQIHQRSQARVECCLRWDALGSQFRRDVWSSTRVAMADERTLILLQDTAFSEAASSTRIKYSISGNRITRTFSRFVDAQETAKEEPLHRESSPLLPNEFSQEQGSDSSEGAKAAFERSGTNIILRLHQPIVLSGTESATREASPNVKRTFTATLSRWIVSDAETTNTSTVEGLP
jgi:prepilin-type N-terminal cleavage/methylation domain-containing protein